MKYSALWVPSALPFFMFGFCYYLVSPVFVLNIYPENRIFSAALNYVDLEYFGMEYLFDLVVIALSFLLGYLAGERGESAGGGVVDSPAYFKICPALLFIVFFMLLLLFSFRAYSVGVIFFSGYSQYDISVLGPFATLVFLSALFYNYFQGFCSRLGFLFIFIVSSILMLSLGSRMFFVLGVIAISVGHLSRNKRMLRSPLLYVAAFLFLCFVTGVGVWRSGGDVTPEELLTIFFAEPVLTATSGAIYIENMGGRPILSMPRDIIASIVNFVPSLLFPGKLSLIEGLIYDEYKESPFGASSIIVNIYSNFGMLYPLYFLGVGLFLGMLRRRSGASEFYRAVYFSILPLLMFHFFREGFVTVVKVIFFNGFILPFIMVFVMSLFFGVSRGRKVVDEN